MIKNKYAIGSTFWSVLGWTLVWAVAATFSNYFLGMILAMVINRKGTRAKGMWRAIFMLSAAVPQFVSLLLVRTIFSQNGIVNTLLINNRQCYSILEQCNTCQSHGNCHQYLDRNSIYRHAGHRNSPEHTGGDIRGCES